MCASCGEVIAAILVATRLPAGKRGRRSLGEGTCRQVALSLYSKYRPVWVCAQPALSPWEREHGLLSKTIGAWNSVRSKAFSRSLVPRAPIVPLASASSRDMSERGCGWARGELPAGTRTVVTNKTHFTPCLLSNCSYHSVIFWSL